MELNTNQLTLSWLNSAKGIGNGKIKYLLEYFNSPEAVWDNFSSEINNLTELSQDTKDYLIKTKRNFPDYIENKLNEENASIVTFFDEDYPKRLINIDIPPYILYYKGNINEINNLTIAIVGSRKATKYGMSMAEKFTKELSELGVNIVSGLAYGIDGIVHRTAIKNNALTYGIIGCGIDMVYPKSNEYLYKNIVESHGAVITEFPFNMQPLPYNFPIRNRIISGLSNGVLVIEAQQKSGTLITASHAAEQGREIFAVPGNINSLYSKGTNLLIKDGAKITTCVEDIVEEILELKSVFNKSKNEFRYDLNEEENKIINLLKTGEKTIYEIAEEIDMDVSDILSNLTILEMKDVVKQMPGNKFFVDN
ncbi:MAG: DNA-processing protein DprA [Tissierellia bacterium]|nr:DNA-processing protein DprA [Tissierellia bacterium]MDD4779546.1 DNA-processing protein DprA [Tissierellia bacterium]